MLQIAYENLVTWFNPHMGNAYMHYPLYGSAKISERTKFSFSTYTIKNGKLISYIHNYKIESNGMYDYIMTKEKHNIQYSDSTIIVTCDFHRDGPKKTSSHLQTYPITDSSLINDSTFIISKNKWTLTADEHHWLNQTETENDLWNIEVIFEKGLPVKIKRGKYILLYFKYLEFDKFGNWLKREIINEDGPSRVQIRSIEYSCEFCSGKGYIPSVV